MAAVPADGSTPEGRSSSPEPNKAESLEVHPPALRRAPYEFLAVMAVVCGMQLMLPNVFTLGQWWVGWPVVEAPWGIWAFLVLRHEHNWARPGVRRGVTGLLILTGLAVAANSAMLVTLLFDNADPTGTRLLFAGVAVVVMNVLVFGLMYWWWDSGGPITRLGQTVVRRDLLFPQQAGEGAVGNPDWQPRPADYLYTAYTNVFAFSPTDTMPLTVRAKALFTVQSAISLMTIMVTLGLAVNLLG